MIKVDWHGNGAWVNYYSLDITTGKYVLEWFFSTLDEGPPDPMTSSQKAVLMQTIGLLSGIAVDVEVL